MEDEIFSLCKVGKKEFEIEQRQDKSLAKISKRAHKKSIYEYKVQIVVRKTADQRGLVRIQVVVPTKFRPILRTCHESTAAHLRVKKTKHKPLRCFFWSNVIKDPEHLVKSHTPCQIVGKIGEKKPL